MMRRRVVSLLLAVCLLLGCVPVVYAQDANSIGENVTWTHDPATATLTLSGTGPTQESFPDWFWGGKKYSVKTLIVEEGITELGKGIFYGFQTLENVSLPKSLTTIGPGAFNNSGFAEIEIPEGVVSIGDGAFLCCNNLKKISLPSTCTQLGNQVFYYTALESIVLPEGLVHIGSSVFNSCSYLTKVTFPSTLKSMGDTQFGYGSCVEEIVFLGDAPAIPDNAFQHVTATVFYPQGNDTWNETNMLDYGGSLSWVPMGDGGLDISGTVGTGISWSIKGTKLTITGSKGCAWPAQADSLPWLPLGIAVTEVEISGVPTIPDRAFYNFTEMTKFTWPEGITAIGREAFYWCAKLESAPIPQTVQTIGAGAFRGCTSLSKVTLPSDLKRLEEYTFYGCESLKNIKLPENLEFLGNCAFERSGLLSIIIPGSVYTVGSAAFCRCYNLSYVIMREGVSWLAYRAFNGTIPLDNIVIPKSMSFIENGSFDGVGLFKVAYLGNVPDKACPSGEDGTYYAKGKKGWTDDPDRFRNLRAVDDPLAWVPYAPESLTGPITAASDPNKAERIYCKVPSGSQRIIFIPLTNSSHSTVLMKVNSDGTYTLLPDTYYTEAGLQVTLTSSATVIAVDNGIPFPDVGKDFWAVNEIGYMSARGYMSGKLDGTFAPGETITRKTVAMLLWRMEGSPAVSGKCPLTDVKQDRYYDAITWACQAGVINGYADGTFRPDADLTRQHLAVMLYRYAQYKGYEFEGGYNGQLTKFSDYAAIYGWAGEACQWALDNQLINGRADGTYDPQGNASRAQFAVILSRFLQKVRHI